MITDLIFDLFGTLVGYTHGAFVGEPYRATHQMLLNAGFAVSYDDFVRTFTAVSDDMEQTARKNCIEYHMRDVGTRYREQTFKRRNAFHECPGRYSSRTRLHTLA